MAPTNPAAIRAVSWKSCWGIAAAILIASTILFGCGDVAAPGSEAPGSLAAAADTAAPSTPDGLVATANSTSRIVLTWTASFDNVGVTGYTIYRDGTPLATVGPVTAYQNSGLTPNTSYSYTVLAFDRAGNRSPQSTAASATTFAPDSTPPSVPTGLAATPVSASRIDLTWTASTDNVGVTGYEIYRDGTLIATLGVVTSYQNTGLTPSTSYSYTVLAIDAAGNLSPQSPAANATTMAPDGTPPSVPAAVTATPVSGSQISLTWVASIDNVAVAGYRVFQGGVPLVTLGNITAYQVTGLTPGTVYSFTVSAIDGATNESAQSAPAIAVTLTATGTATLEWDAVTDPLLRGYRVYFSSTDQNHYQVSGQGLDVGNVTTYTLTGLLRGTRYYFKATAYDTSNIESTYSNEIFTDIP